MTLIADILLGGGAFGAAYYCYVLSSRLTIFTRLETGMGGAIAVLSTQVDDMTRAIEVAQDTAHQSTERLAELTQRAKDTAKQLELMLAALHDLPEGELPPKRSRVLHRGSQRRLETEAA